MAPQMQIVTKLKNEILNVMNILKKPLAPIADKAWEEILLQSERVINTFQTGRKFADVSGPKGIEFGAISTGKLRVPSNQSVEGVQIGIREVVPVLEVRKSFELNRWELDNASRDMSDLDLGALEKAAQQVASFEDQCLYYGFDNSIAQGLANTHNKPVKAKMETRDFLHKLATQVISLQKDAVEGPYALILPDEVWSALVSDSVNYPLQTLVKEITSGTIITHHVNQDSFLVSERGGDFELHLGQDISIGYENHDKEKVNLFFTESFVYQIHSPEAVRMIQAQKK